MWQGTSADPEQGGYGGGALPQGAVSCSLQQPAPHSRAGPGLFWGAAVPVPQPGCAPARTGFEGFLLSVGQHSSDQLFTHALVCSFTVRNHRGWKQQIHSQIPAGVPWASIRLGFSLAPSHTDGLSMKWPRLYMLNLVLHFSCDF